MLISTLCFLPMVLLSFFPLFDYPAIFGLVSFEDTFLVFNKSCTLSFHLAVFTHTCLVRLLSGPLLLPSEPDLLIASFRFSPLCLFFYFPLFRPPSFSELLYWGLSSFFFSLSTLSPSLSCSFSPFPSEQGLLQQ